MWFHVTVHFQTVFSVNDHLNGQRNYCCLYWSTVMVWSYHSNTRNILLLSAQIYSDRQAARKGSQFSDPSIYKANMQSSQAYSNCWGPVLAAHKGPPSSDPTKYQALPWPNKYSVCLQNFLSPTCSLHRSTVIVGALLQQSVKDHNLLIPSYTKHYLVQINIPFVCRIFFPQHVVFTGLQ